MAPLEVGDGDQPFSEKSEAQWEIFEKQLQDLKARGIQGVSTDIWWGLVESKEGQYQWQYYERMARLIEKVGLQWIPILSFHQLGGNIGDKGFRPIPDWIWNKYIGLPGVVDADSLKYKSEKFNSDQKNYSSEVVSVWGTKYVIEDYRRFVKAFVEKFASWAWMVPEVNISLGPAGELRYPSYNPHDAFSYPDRGNLQAYSELAIEDFRQYVENKYATIAAVNKAWGFELLDFSQIFPPNPDLVDSFLFHNKEHMSPYGKDFFDWYNESLTRHGYLVLSMAIEELNHKNSKFQGVDVGAKIPGIHWRKASDRLAELTAGLIRASYPDWLSAKYSFGYQHTLELFKAVDGLSDQSRFVLHFTALEMKNGHDAHMGAHSEAKSLVFRMGQSAKAMGLEIKGENALGPELRNPEAWHHMKDALIWGGYSGLTLLRVGADLESQEAREGLKAIVDLNKSVSNKCNNIYQ